MQYVIVSFNIMHSFVLAVILCSPVNKSPSGAYEQFMPADQDSWLSDSYMAASGKKRSAGMEFYPSPSPSFLPPYCQLKIMLPVTALLEVFSGSKILS